MNNDNGHMLIHLTHDEPGQGHASDAADQLDSGTIVDVALLHGELFRLGFIVIKQVNLKGAPLHRARVEVPILNMQVPSAYLGNTECIVKINLTMEQSASYRLRAKPVEESNLCATGDAKICIL